MNKAGSIGAGALTLGALGVVFGDIGTSPLYALQAVYVTDGIRPDQGHVYGIISLVFWSITIIVSIKYVSVIMRADNEGEGGIMALIALVQTGLSRRRSTRAVLIALGIFGAALFYGDGMITPAISVLSAVEGLKVAAPGLGSLVVPIALGVLTVLFAIQRFGTKAVGRLFGPVMAVWFTVIALAGLLQVIHSPGILRALSPVYGIEFFVNDGAIAFLALGAVVLAVTGAEALYADMGHFGWPAIRRAWFFFVFPALTLNYLGQGALILANPTAVSNPFFLLMPSWALLPMVLLATIATVIASQAVISGAFSVTRQAVALGFLPKLHIRHTSDAEGQVYVPAVNALLFVAVVGLVLGFETSTGLASAYGIAVTGTLAIDTILFFVVARTLWHTSLWVVVPGAAAFLVVDLAFFGANLPKVVHGGWFPLTLALVV
ncbi:MAG: system potassium uptake protein, partial [Pseudonocardiales bacterium]|nr:system potassium uptake protein [Pseudonocardiales bacterium]